jgi:2-polyprenyl-6-methoxyphenol hydroxylase-like FAD-dependent oxidoreductase
MATVRFDVCVVGGGPAGSVTAFRLARFGHRVCLVERCAFPRTHVGESLTRGVWPLLDGLGVLEPLFREGFLCPGQTQIRWSRPDTERVSPTQSGTGLLVDRGKFDALLLHAAVSAGARFFQPAQARGVNCGDSGRQVEVTAGGETRRIRADYLVDAAGRTAFLPGKRRTVGPRTVALCGYLQSRDCPHDTLVEALPDAWCWGAPVPGGLFSTMVFLDADTVPGLRRTGLETLWRARLAGAELFAGLSRSPLVRPVLARDATTYHAADPIGEDFVRVGEASFSLDPLSSTGVEKAMHSGLVAAIALHTMIAWPGRKDLCQRFYRDRQREAISAHAAWSASFYHQVARFSGLPFWKSRSDAGGYDLPNKGPTRASLPEGPISLAARVRLSDEARLVQEPCIVGDEIRAHTALVHPGLERPVAFVEGIELGQLIEMVPSCADLAGLLAVWSSRVPPWQARRLTGWLIDNQILETAS